MKADDLLDVIGELEELCLDPVEEKPRQRKIVWTGIGSLAACLLLFLFLPNGFFGRMTLKNEADYVSKDYTGFLVYYPTGGTLGSFHYEIHGGYEEMFFAWKNQNGIGSEVELKNIELHLPLSGGEHVPDISPNAEYIVRVTVNSSFSDYLEKDVSGLLLESLKKTVSSYTGFRICDIELIFSE